MRRGREENDDRENDEFAMQAMQAMQVKQAKQAKRAKQAMQAKRAKQAKQVKQAKQARKKYSTALSDVAAAVASGVDTPPWRLKLANEIARGEIDVRYPRCDLSKLHDLKGIPKNSASLTSIILAEHDGAYPELPRNVLFKASFGLTTKKLPKAGYGSRTGYQYDDSLSIELLNYEFVANVMIRKRWTPNLASYVASFQCSPKDLASLPNEEKAQILYNSMYAMDGKCLSVKCAVDQESDNLIFDRNIVNVLITERMTGEKLEDWMQRPHPLAMWKSVLFQILYTLECFNRIGFRHNDLHLGNIFIENIPGAPMYTFYMINDDDADYLKVPTKNCQVRIYDFDRSTLLCNVDSINPAYAADITIPYERKLELMSAGSVTGCENTRMRLHCEREGACQAPNAKFDAFTVLGLLWASTEANFEKMEHKYVQVDNDGRESFGGGLFSGGQIPPAVIDFIEQHLHRVNAPYNPLEIVWHWPYRMVRVRREVGVFKAGRGNYQLPDNVMSSVEQMLHDRSFFDFDKGSAAYLRQDCEQFGGEIYHLPMRPEQSAPNFDSVSCNLPPPL